MIVRKYFRPLVRPLWHRFGLSLVCFESIFVLGFGAKLPASDEVSHLFPLNDNPVNPCCSGVDEILIHYRSQLGTVQMHGPKNIGPVIDNTAAIAEQFQDGSHYFVLVIITSGKLTDMFHTKRAIVNASALPLSIIIGKYHPEPN